MMEEYTHDIWQLSTEENNLSTANFTEEEVHEAISQMEHNKAPGPDDFPAEFYQHFLDVIKNDLLAMYSQVQTGELLLFKLNFRVITLLLKKENAVQIQQYRPICVALNFLRKFPLITYQTWLIR
jgi:hypothetical protein